MNCPKCGCKIDIQLATKLNCKGARILTELTSILTVQCEKCNHIFQMPIQIRSMLSVKDKDL